LLSPIPLNPLPSSCPPHHSSLRATRLEQGLQADGEVVVVDVFAGEGREQGVQRVVHLASRRLVVVVVGGWVGGGGGSARGGC
jgi:hypothetical protein